MIQPRAQRDGDQWVVNGQKVWTTYAQHADWCMVFCRTDPESHSHHGLSYLLCPVQQPGVEQLHREPRGVIAAILQGPQPLEQYRYRVAPAGISHDAAHRRFSS